MQVYLPIAEMAVNPYLMVGIGAIVGAISGLFGIGGGFLLTPLLMLFGIPAPIAVVSGANVSAASSMSSLISQLERKAIDLRMGLLVSIAGVIGVGFGAMIFRFINKIGYAEPVVRLAYVLLLGAIGYSLISEAIRASNPNIDKAELHLKRKSNIGHRLPLKIRFPRSKLFVSIIPPIIIGFIIGMLSAILGVGGGFLLIPALIFIVNLPPSLVVGTSIFQVVIMSSTTTFVQASVGGTLDLVLVGMLIIGAVIGAQIGTIFGKSLKTEQLRLFLGAIVSVLAIILAGQLFFEPSDLFSTSSAGGGL